MYNIDLISTAVLVYCTRYSHLRFVKCETLLEADLPVKPKEFENLVTKQCSKCREILENEYVLLN